jgi:hypothetical protein
MSENQSEKTKPLNLDRDTDPGTTPSVEEFIMMQRGTVDTAKGNQLGYRAWLHAPAVLQFLSLADRLLTNASELRGRPVTQVNYVQVALAKGQGILYIQPCEELDTDSVPVTRNGSRVTVNLWNLLGPTELDLPTGYRALYAVDAYDHSSLGQSIKIDLTLPLERRTQPKRKSKNKAKATTPQPATPGEPTVATSQNNT